MGRFSKKKTSEEIYGEIADKIVLAALGYRTEITDNVSHKLSADAGAEIIYFLMNWIDKVAFQTFGATKRDEIYDAIYEKAISQYCKAILTPDVPQDLLENLAIQMLKTLNERQIIYSQCTPVTKEFPFPSA